MCAWYVCVCVVCAFYYMLLFTFFIHYEFSVNLYIFVSLVAFLLIALCSFEMLRTEYMHTHTHKHKKIYLARFRYKHWWLSLIKKANKRRDIKRERIESHRNALIVWLHGRDIGQESNVFVCVNLIVFFLCVDILQFYKWITPYNFLFRVTFRNDSNICICVYGVICRLECDRTL